MTFIVIYARRDCPSGGWQNLVTTGFDVQGNSFTGEALNDHQDIVALVVPDDETPPHHFLPTRYLCVHTNAGEQEQKNRAGFTQDAYPFTHQKGNSIFELLKMLIPTGDLERKSWAIAVLMSLAIADRERIAFLEFSMMKQIELLHPGQYVNDLHQAKIKIGMSEFGKRLLAGDVDRGINGESLGAFIERMHIELNHFEAPI